MQQVYKRNMSVLSRFSCILVTCWFSLAYNDYLVSPITTLQMQVNDLKARLSTNPFNQETSVYYFDTSTAALHVVITDLIGQLDTRIVEEISRGGVELMRAVAHFESTNKNERLVEKSFLEINNIEAVGQPVKEDLSKQVSNIIDLKYRIEKLGVHLATLQKELSNDFNCKITHIIIDVPEKVQQVVIADCKTALIVF